MGDGVMDMRRLSPLSALLVLTVATSAFAQETTPAVPAMPTLVGPDTVSSPDPIPVAEPPPVDAAVALPPPEGPGDAASPDLAPPDLAVPGEAEPGAVATDATLPHDLTPMGMFMAADWVVKGVLLGLLFASVLTWTVALVKVLELWGGGRRLTRLGRALAQVDSIAEARLVARAARGPEVHLVHEALAETEVSVHRGASRADGLVDRVASRLARVEARLTRRMNRGTGILAIIGSAAPFIGLFGTVWGIMNAFIGISKSQTTNLAVVAPGIAEALLATAIGLVAAIPAVILYNLFARSIGGYKAGLADLSADLERKVGRDADGGMTFHVLSDVAE
jgi:biopolymer transport protein ExbB